MAEARRAITKGDTVVVVDIAGQLVRDREDRVMRGVVTHINVWCEATVSLVRSGRKVSASTARLRRCPSLAYCRPEPTSPGAA